MLNNYLEKTKRKGNQRSRLQDKRQKNTEVVYLFQRKEKREEKVRVTARTWLEDRNTERSRRGLVALDSETWLGRLRLHEGEVLRMEERRLREG